MKYRDMREALRQYVEERAVQKLELRLLNWTAPFPCGCVGYVSGTMPITEWKYLHSWAHYCEEHGLLEQARQFGRGLTQSQVLCLRESQRNQWITLEGHTVPREDFDRVLRQLIQLFGTNKNTKEFVRRSWPFTSLETVEANAYICYGGSLEYASRNGKRDY